MSELTRDATSVTAPKQRPLSKSERAFYGEGAHVLVPSSIGELADLVRECESRSAPIVPVGAGAHASCASPPDADARFLSSAAFQDIVRYEPDDFTIGVGAGMKLKDFHEALRRNGQEIPVDFLPADEGTCGGLVARAPSTPRRGLYGPLGTFLLGVEGVRGEGKPFKVGGMVVKNVAGYELGKFLAGARGRGGFLTRVNFKLRPVPAARSAELAGFEDGAAAWSFATRLRGLRLEPAVLFVLAGEAGRRLAASGLAPPAGAWLLAWIFEGSRASVEWQASEARKALAAPTRRGAVNAPLAGDESRTLLEVLVAAAEPQGVPGSEAIVRVSALPSTLPKLMPLALRALGTYEGFRAELYGDAATGLLTVRWEAPFARVGEPLPELRRLAEEHGGSARLLALPPSLWRKHETSLTKDPNRALSERIFRAFDPRGVFERNRQHAGSSA
jgi:glycolate oxidase FAD binding subunit